MPRKNIFLMVICCFSLRTLDAMKLQTETESVQQTTEAPSSEAPADHQNISTRPIANTSIVQAPVARPPSSLSGLVPIPLGLFPDSVDDMYYGCSNKMLIKVKRHHLPLSTREGLNDAFTRQCAVKAMKAKDAYDPLSWHHMRALCAYTGEHYDALNRAVRIGKSSYRTSFQFHALHFLLSDAIRLLKLHQRSCYKVYRRSRKLYSGEVGQTMRFGSFASSSLSRNLRQFGRTTCFEIRTCFGAFLKSYSELEADEEEVLIPPYEMFNIVSVDRLGQNDLQCEVYYKLETAGVYSNLNCKAVNF